MNIKSIIKDKTTSLIVKQFANSLISEFGELKTIKIDSTLKTISLSVNLKGENDDIKIDVNGYKVIKSPNSSFIQFQEISTSREWLNIVIQKYYRDRQIEIPKQFIRIIDFLL